MWVEFAYFFLLDEISCWRNHLLTHPSFGFIQLYTLSQDGTLCIWESNTKLDGLIRQKEMDKPKPRGQEEEEEEEEDMVENKEGEVIRGKAETPKRKDETKKVRYKQRSK